MLWEASFVYSRSIWFVSGFLKLNTFMRKKLLMRSSAREGIHFTMIFPEFSNRIKSFSFLFSFLSNIFSTKSSSNYGDLGGIFTVNILFRNLLFIEIIQEVKASEMFSALLPHKRC